MHLKKNDEYYQLDRLAFVEKSHKELTIERIPILKNPGELYQIIEHYSKCDQINEEEISELSNSLEILVSYLSNDQIDTLQVHQNIEPVIIDQIVNIFNHINISEIEKLCIMIFAELMDTIDFYLASEESILHLVHILRESTSMDYHHWVQYLVAHSIKNIFDEKLLNPIEWYSLSDSFDTPLLLTYFLCDITGFENYIPSNQYTEISRQIFYCLKNINNFFGTRDIIVKNSFLTLFHLAESLENSRNSISNHDFSNALSMNFSTLNDFYQDIPSNMEYFFLFLRKLLDIQICIDEIANDHVVRILIQQLHTDDTFKEERSEKIFKYLAHLTNYYPFEDISKIIENLDQYQFPTKQAALLFIIKNCHSTGNFMSIDIKTYNIILDFIIIPDFTQMDTLLDAFLMLIMANDIFIEWTVHDYPQFVELGEVLDQVSHCMNENEKVCSNILSIKKIINEYISINQE